MLDEPFDVLRGLDDALTGLGVDADEGCEAEIGGGCWAGDVGDGRGWGRAHGSGLLAGKHEGPGGSEVNVAFDGHSPKFNIFLGFGPWLAEKLFVESGERDGTD